jgi:hypothetical protein
MGRVHVGWATALGCATALVVWGLVAFTWRLSACQELNGEIKWLCASAQDWQTPIIVLAVGLVMALVAWAVHYRHIYDGPGWSR